MGYVDGRDPCLIVAGGMDPQGGGLCSWRGQHSGELCRTLAQSYSIV